MQIVQDKTDHELLQSLLAEIAKAKNELKCSQGDIDKAQSRISFLVVIANELLNRAKDQKE